MPEELPECNKLQIVAKRLKAIVSFTNTIKGT